MADIIPLTVSLEGGPNLQPMIVSASQIHRVVKSKDLNKLAKQMLKERTERWRKAKLKREYPKPASPLGTPSPDTSPPLEERSVQVDNAPLDDDDADLRPSPLKFRRTKESYQALLEQGEPSRTAQALGWEDVGLVDNEIPAGIATAAGGVKQEDELLSLANSSWEPVIPPSSSPEEDTATEMLAEVSAATNVPMPSALDLSQITPKPIYVPEKQPEHLHHKTVKQQEKTALERYEEEQKDTKEVIGKGNKKFIATMHDSEHIISARPDGQVILMDNDKGVIEIKTSSTSLTLEDAVTEREIKFLELEPGSTEYTLKRKHDYYHQVQAEIYAGQDDKITFCDFVTYLERKGKLNIERIRKDQQWCDRNIPRVREFCQIYDQLIQDAEAMTADTK